MPPPPLPKNNLGNCTHVSAQSDAVDRLSSSYFNLNTFFSFQLVSEEGRCDGSMSTLARKRRAASPEPRPEPSYYGEKNHHPR